ncbi:MAG: DUF2007 domain-containing protein [Planctomycetota bacterium]
MSGQGDKTAEPVRLGSFKNEFEASLAKNALAEAGIPCELVGQLTAGFRAEAPGSVSLLVRSQDAELAREILALDETG